MLLIVGCVRGGGVADRGAIHDELDAAVALTAIGGVIRRHRLRFSKAARDDR